MGRDDINNSKSNKFSFMYWHKRAALQSVAVRRSNGNEVSVFFSPSSIFLIEGVLGSKNLFSDFFFLFFFFYSFYSFFLNSLIFVFFISPPLLLFLIEGVLGSKNLFSKSCRERPKT